MSFFSNVPETRDRYGGYIAEFKELFRKHELSFGKAEDFFPLAPKLAYDSEFRTAFAGLTESVRKREDGKLTLTRMLTIIAIAMGGPEIETLGSASAVPISLVVVFLAGVGGWSETEPEIVTKSPQEQASGSVNLPTADRSVAAGSKQEEEREQQRLASGPSHNLSEPRRVRPALQFTEPELVAPSLEELAAVEASFRGKLETEPVEADASNVVDRSAVETMLRAAELKSVEPIEEQAPLGLDRSAVEAPQPSTLTISMEMLQAEELKSVEPIEEQAPVAVHRSTIEAILRAAELEKAEPVEMDAPVVADRYKAEAMPHASELPREEVVAPVEEEREAVETKVQSVEPHIEPPRVEALPIAAPVVIADKYESVRVRRLHRMIAVLGVFLFLLAGFAAALLYRDRDWLVQTLVKNRPANAASFAGDGKEGLRPPDRGGGASSNAPTHASSNAPTQSMQTGSVVTPQSESKSSGNLGQGELSGGRANGPTDTGSNRTVQDQAVMNRAQASSQAKQPPVLESAPAKIPSTKQEAPPALAAAGPGWMVAGPGSVSGATLSRPLPVTASEVHIIRINSWAMSKNLIDSPKPAYPPEARFQRVEGDVLVRALISENGAIDRATAVNGPQPLRGAAEIAMRQWRYKPYIVDGMPVKVQTDVNFHFSLKPE